MATVDFMSLGGNAHPYLHEPRIYIANLPAWVTDFQLAPAFATCAPFRPSIPRDGISLTVSGTIEFKFLDKAEKALATLNGRMIPDLPTPVQLILSPYPATNPPTALPPPNAQPRLVKHLPMDVTDSDLYDIFRPFGALASVHVQSNFGPDTGVVEFWREEDARAAEEALHCADIHGSNIAVQVYQPQRARNLHALPPAPPSIPPALGPFDVSAGSFVSPGAMSPYAFSALPSPPPHQATYSPSPPRGSPYLRPSNVFVHGPGQQVQQAAPGTSHSGLIDPCNLFCKNLDPSIDSNGLFSHFRSFGQIVSARVMRNESGESRGFGFVSYQTPEQAAAALKAMNGAVLGTKAIVVRLHEPKQMRQEKLAARFAGGNGHPRSVSGNGATSPTPSDLDAFHQSQSPPLRASSVLGSPRANGGPQRGASPPERERPRRGSGSYYQAALAGNLNVPMEYENLSALSPVVRKEVLTGELSRRVKAVEGVSSGEVDAVVDSLVALSLQEVVDVIQSEAKLQEQVRAAQKTIAAAPKDEEPSVPASAAQPSTPLSPPLVTPPRTASPAGSTSTSAAPAPALPERERMAAAIARIESERVPELTELLMSLPKRERAMCLFNVEVLRAKVGDAKAVLDLDDDEEEPAPVMPAKKAVAKAAEANPATPDLSRAPSAPPSPLPTTPNHASAVTAVTVEQLAKLPAVEIVRLAKMPGAVNPPLVKADPAVVESTDSFVDGLLDKPVQQQKQALGDKLFRVIKTFGIKGAPKLTIALLDQEDLRSLAHLMNSYPTVLKEKVLLVQKSVAAK